MWSSRTLFAYKRIETNKKNNPFTWDKKHIWKKTSYFKILWICIISIIMIWIIIISIRMQLNVFKNLPDVSQVKDMTFSQATIITDKNWEELYKFFDENREYVEINKISNHMLNAIVAIEDQHYREHEWLDPRAIFRAAITWKWWASTLPQQLMTNVFKLKSGLYSDNKYQNLLNKAAYKLRQIVLSKRLNSTLQKQIKAENPNLSSSETKKEMKKKTLELYLNYIDFWNNSFWVEAASKSFFGISAENLSIAQSAILASLPKWPTQYSPLSEQGRKNLVGYFTITDINWNSYPFEWTLKENIISKFSDAIKQSNFSSKTSSNSAVSFLIWLWEFSIILDWKQYQIKYHNWRKDVVISRMFEDWYITEQELKDAEIESLKIEFKSASFSIKAPHFVFWIKELLEQQYGENTIMEWGLVVKTSLDYNIQKIAEQAFQNNSRTLYENWANNSSMLYVNTNNWDVLAYVGSLDYFNDSIQWQIDMVRSPRQSWSSIKPLIYALGFMKLPITIDTPIYDIEYQVWPDKPNNADNSYEWLLTLKAALWHSRNIPAIKMFVAVWWENSVKPYLQSLGLPLLDDLSYWYPLSIWAAEVSLLDFAWAYSHLTTDTPAEINPILEITTKDWSVIYKKEIKEKENIIPAWVRYLIWKILSDPNNRLTGWVNKFNVSWLSYALKTWTSNMKTAKWNRPRDWLVAAYTPDNLILMRAWNADASPMNANAYWGTIQAQPLKEFLGWLVKNWFIINQEMENVETATLNISKITWKLPAENMPNELITSTIWYINNLPWTSDNNISIFEYDASCLWISSPLTPLNEQKQWYFMELSSFMPGNSDLEDIKKRRTEKAKIPTWNEWSLKINILTEIPELYCENREPIESDEIQIAIIDPETDQRISAKPSILYSVKSNHSIKTLNVSVDWTLVFSKQFTKKLTEEISNIDLDLTQFEAWKHTITLQAIDISWQTNSTSITDVMQPNDDTPPYLVKERSKILHNEWWKNQITLTFDDELSWIPWWKVSSEWNLIKNFEWRLVSFETNAEIIDIEVKDLYWNTLIQSININEL